MMSGGGGHEKPVKMKYEDLRLRVDRVGVFVPVWNELVLL